MEREIWFAYLWSVSLADHLGDVLDATEALAKILKLQFPCADLGELHLWLQEQGWNEDSKSLWEYARESSPIPNGEGK